ncbi:DUF411 domain-containing protein [Rhizobium sp. Leaf386]|uniref:DUF411 domain-containing protein n=1 Tax=Rhizobium sp. Leaf386 TaxID=1736359 RepID=UPI000715AE3C|nr:DUF411 domain-containing protein [Rhizobium sp. Leaf386]KQT04070.1 hypothetical protein ASG50_17825 [Rhizobium sp. Leaf386]
MKRRQFLYSIVAAGSISLIAVARAAGESMIVYKDPNCGCCDAWAEAMKKAGFSVQAEDVDDLNIIKERFAVPAEMQGCHTAVVVGYYVEGHVPVDAVKKLVAERPQIAGLAVPGMPEGSLGMGDDPKASYDVYAVNKDGSSILYQAVRPKT